MELRGVLARGAIGQALAAHELAAHDETVGSVRIGPLRRDLPARDRWRPVGFQLASALTSHPTAVHTTRGAANEWTTQAGYAHLAEIADHPTLSVLLRRITKQEGRHIEFSATQALGRLAGSRTARRITRCALHRFWASVDSGIAPCREVDFLPTHLFGDADDLSMVERIDRRVDRLAGLDGFHILSAAVAA